MNFRSNPRRYRHGFTSVELLVVMAMITILIAAAATMLRADDSAKLRASVRQAGAVFEQARTLALTRSEPARVVVLEDPSDESRHRRVVAIATCEHEEWEVVSNRVILPDGVVFDASQEGVPGELMVAESVRGETASWRYFEIAANGTFSGGSPNFVVALGVVDEGGAITVPDELKVDGFRLTAAARPFYFREPGEIGRNLPE